MRRIINILVFIPILIIGCNKSTKIQTINEDIEDDSVHISTEIQEEVLNKIMYVNSPEGLRVRNLPSINGDRIGLLDYLTEVKIIKENNEIVSIEGIEGKWVNIITPIEGWVFNGFLENYDEHIKKIDNVTKSRRFTDEGFGFKYDLSEYNSRTTFIENHGNPINTAKKSVINRHNGLEDKILTLEYNNFIVEFYEWNENVVGSFPESMMLSIESKDNVEYLYGIKHGMTKEELEAIIGIPKIENDSIWSGDNSIHLNGNEGSVAHISFENNKIVYIVWRDSEP